MNAPWLTEPVQPLDQALERDALAYQNQLTKPAGSLGRLEALAVRLAALQGRLKPAVDRVAVSVFAADHGVAQEGVSAFPQAVTAEMVRNFARGGAAISVLARRLGARFEVVNLGTVAALEPLEGVVEAVIAPGTANFCTEPAMTPEQLERALEAGRAAARRAGEAQLFIGGEMGIANTTSAAALSAALLQRAPGELVGPGTGIDSAGVRHKTQVIERALALHAGAEGPLQQLRCLGGFEIAALCGAYIASAQQGRAVLVDGFISTVAALAAVRINPGVAPWLLYSHQSAEPGHRALLQALDAQPLLDLGMRLGEGSGAAAAVPLLQAACALQGEMATFTEAAVSPGA